MTREVRIGEETVILDSEKLYSGIENPGREEGNARKALGLPAKRQLVFYKDRKDPGSAARIVKYRLVRMHGEEEPWYTVEITLEDGSLARIHSGFLAEMQKSGFMEEMGRAAAE